MKREDPEITERLINVSDAISNMQEVLRRFDVDVSPAQLMRFMPREKKTVTLFEMREIIVDFVNWMYLVKQNLANRYPPEIIWPHIQGRDALQQIMIALLNKFEEVP